MLGDSYQHYKKKEGMANEAKKFLERARNTQRELFEEGYVTRA